MAQCVVHALKGLLAAHVSLRLARLPRTASTSQRTCRLRSTHAAAPVLFVHAEVKKTMIFLTMGPILRHTRGILCFSQFFRCTPPTPGLPGLFANTASRTLKESNNARFVIDRSKLRPKVSIQLTKAIAAGTEILVSYGKLYASVLKSKIAAAAEGQLRSYVDTATSADLQVEDPPPASASNPRMKRKCALCARSYWPRQQVGHCTRCVELEPHLRGSRMTGVSFGMCFP
jgi:hypothetical protein